MKFSLREKALFAAPLLMLAFALAPSLISNLLFQQVPDRIVIANNNSVAITKLRMVVYGHPNRVITIENVPPFSMTWRVFNQNWAEQVTGLWPGQHGGMIRIEGELAGGGRFGHDQFYCVERPSRFPSPSKLVITVEGLTLYPSEFHPSSRSQNESFWRDLGDVLFHQPEEKQNSSTSLKF
ncbi:hypothetical protein IAD21_04986 [Abditibacteriota bacterium]|nr:hypothetical protein IAD21_04986 [Abditibacteriota bacterium]